MVSKSADLEALRKHYEFTLEVEGYIKKGAAPGLASFLLKAVGRVSEIFGDFQLRLDVDSGDVFALIALPADVDVQTAQANLDRLVSALEGDSELVSCPAIFDFTYV